MKWPIKWPWNRKDLNLDEQPASPEFSTAWQNTVFEPRPPFIVRYDNENKTWLGDVPCSYPSCKHPIISVFIIHISYKSITSIFRIRTTTYYSYAFACLYHIDILQKILGKNV